MVGALKKCYTFWMDCYQKLLEGRAKKKREIFGKMFFPRTPVLLLDISENKKSEEYLDLIEGLNAINLTTLVIPPSENGLVMPYSKNIHCVSRENTEAAYEAADFIVTFNRSVTGVWKCGGVPIAQLDGDSTMDYNPLKEKGNGFYFKNPTKWEVFAAIVRALETYQFPYDWENLLRQILKTR